MSTSLFPDFSEERLAAFIDGMLSPEEMASFEKDIAENPIMRDILTDVQLELQEIGSTAMDDFSGFRPEETIGQIISILDSSSIFTNPEVVSLNEMNIPVPLYDDDYCLDTGDLSDKSQNDTNLNGFSEDNNKDTNDDLGY